MKFRNVFLVLGLMIVRVDASALSLLGRGIGRGMRPMRPMRGAESRSISTGSQSSEVPLRNLNAEAKEGTLLNNAGKAEKLATELAPAPTNASAEAGGATATNASAEAGGATATNASAEAGGAPVTNAPVQGATATDALAEAGGGWNLFTRMNSEKFSNNISRGIEYIKSPLTQEARVGLASAVALTGVVGAITAGEEYLRNRDNNESDKKPTDKDRYQTILKLRDFLKNTIEKQGKIDNEIEKLAQDLEAACKASNEARAALDQAEHDFGIDVDNYEQLEAKAEDAMRIAYEKYLNYTEKLEASNVNKNMTSQIKSLIREIKNPGITKRLSKKVGLSAKMYGVKRSMRKVPMYIVDSTTGMWQKITNYMPTMPQNIVNTYHTLVDPVTGVVYSEYKGISNLASQAGNVMYNLGSNAYNNLAKGLNYITPQMLKREEAIDLGRVQEEARKMKMHQEMVRGKQEEMNKMIANMTPAERYALDKQIAELERREKEKKQKAKAGK